MVSIIIPDETLQIYKPKDLFVASTKISNNFNFEYRNNQLIIKLKKDALSKEWIYQITKLLEAPFVKEK